MDFFRKVNLHSSGVRTTITSHLAERTMASDTEPMIINRSTAFNPVAPQTIISALTDSAASFGMRTFGAPYWITALTLSSPSASACALQSFTSASDDCCTSSTTEGA